MTQHLGVRISKWILWGSKHSVNNNITVFLPDIFRKKFLTLKVKHNPTKFSFECEVPDFRLFSCSQHSIVNKLLFHRFYHNPLSAHHLITSPRLRHFLNASLPVYSTSFLPCSFLSYYHLTFSSYSTAPARSLLAGLPWSDFSLFWTSLEILVCVNN